MDKSLCRIIEKLSDVPDGRCLDIRHSLNICEKNSTADKQTADGQKAAIYMIDDTAVPKNARLRTETYELYPGIELSFHCYLASKFHIRRPVRRSLSCRSDRLGNERRTEPLFRQR